MISQQLSVIGAVLLSGVAAGADLDEFKVKRQPIFEFARKPEVTRLGDKVTVTFTSKGYCDATVAVENAEGKIIRHLASGVLGPNAPQPFRKSSLSQSIVWDSKDDRGVYVDDKDTVAVRVSLGLKPQFERTLFWSPYKRVGPYGPILCTAPEGAYVSEGYAVDHIRLFDHQGNYVRTVYPFPADKIDQVIGLRKHRFPPEGRALPLKGGYHQATLLTSGTNRNQRSSAEGFGVSAIGAGHGRLALVHLKLNRLAADGSTGGLPLEGPKTCYLMKLKQKIHARTTALPGPRSACFSPDGKYLYLTGWVWNSGQGYVFDWIHGVVRLEFAKNDEPKVFAGSLKQDDVRTDNTGFKVPTSVACDAKGRVYVSDYINNRVQVFTPDGVHYRTIKVPLPAHVDVHRKTGDIYVFSWLFITRYKTPDKVLPMYTRLGPIENPRVITRCPLPLVGHLTTRSWNNSGGLPFRMAVDSWADEPTIWLVPGAARYIHSGNGSILENWKTSGIRLLVEKDGKLVVKRSFGDDVNRTVKRAKPPILWRQRLYVNPKNERLYVAEGDSGVMKSVNQLVEVDPPTGRIRLLDLPLGSEDLCFGGDGLAYLRTDKVVGRYDTTTWREIPWDYGEERKAGFGMGARAASLIAGLPTPGHRSNPFWHMGGMDVSVKGHLVVNSCNLTGLRVTQRENWHKRFYKEQVRLYAPRLYPGRVRWGEVHVWDRHGKLVYEDAVPGMGHMNGIGIDKDDNIYMMVAARRLINGRNYDPKLPRDVSCTLMKVRARKTKVLSTGGRTPVPLLKATRPGRPLDFWSQWTGGAWIEGADWFFGGVGFNPRGCICWNSRFDLDYFNRSFAPEPLRFSIAVVDSNGNLILRIGRYGNVDDKGIALMHACYVATHTDRRLFIADAGNARVVSVKLGYHATERVALKNVQETRE